MAGADWFVTLEGVEQGPLDAKAVKDLVKAGMIGPMTPVRRDGMGRAVCAAQVKGLLPPEMVEQSGVRGPASVSERATAATEIQEPRPSKVDALTDSGAQRVRGSVPSTRRMAVAAPEPDSRPVKRAPRATESAVEDPDTAAIDGAEHHAGIEARAGFGQRAAARMIDNVVIALIALVFIVGGISIGAAMPAGELAQIEAERAGNVDDQMGYVEWETARLDGKVEIPDRVTKAEGMSEEEFVELKSAYTEAYNEAIYQRQLYDFREANYKADTLRMDAANQQGLVLTLVGVIIGVILVALYLPLTEAIFAASPGKKLLGLAVVDEDLKPVRMGPAILRQVLRLIPFGVFAALRPSRQALHDQFSGTQVVPADQVRAPARRAKRAAGGRSARQTKSGTARQTKSGTARQTRRKR